MSDEIGLLRADLLWERVVKVGDVPLRSLRVNIDGSAPIRRTLTAELEAEESIIPKNSSSALAPYGAEIAIHGGWLEDDNTPIAADSYSRPNGPLGTAETGQAYRILGLPTWEVDNGQAKMVRSETLPYGAAVLDCNTPNVRAGVGVRNASFTGLALRVIDAGNLLTVSAVDSGTPAGMDVYLSRWDAALPIHVRTWSGVGEVGHLLVALNGGQVTVWADGQRLGTETLSASDLAKYSQGTAHGLWSWQGNLAQPNERFDDLRIEHVRPMYKSRLYPGGIYRIDETRLRKTSDERAIFLEAPDRAASVDAGGFRRITTVQPGADIVDRINSMVGEALPGIETNFEDAFFAAPRLLVWEPGDSLWKACQELASSMGMELFFDAAGTLMLRKVPSVVHSVPAANYRVGEDHITSIERSWSTKQGYNHYVVIGQTDAMVPVRGEAFDTDPNSPTQYGGPFGRRSCPPINDPAVGSTLQAQIAAQGHLNRDRGGTQEVEITTHPDWRREAGDVIRLRDDESDLRESDVVDQISISVSKEAKAMTLTTAAKRTVVEEAE